MHETDTHCSMEHGKGEESDTLSSEGLWQHQVSEGETTYT